MKALAATLLLTLWLIAAHAEEPPPPSPPSVPEAPSATPPAELPPPEASQQSTTPPEPLAPLPEHLGYALDRPDVLLRQRLFGFAHGLSMLAAACLDVPEHAAAVENAYAAWYAKQAESIKRLVLDLSAYHYGPRAEEAQWSDIARVLSLKDSIQPALKDVPLEEACRTLPEATTRPRYAFDALLADPKKALSELAPAK